MLPNPRPTSTSAITKNNTIKILTYNIKDVKEVDFDTLTEKLVQNDVPIVCFQECATSGTRRDKLIRSMKSKGYMAMGFSNVPDEIYIRSDAIPTKRDLVPLSETAQKRSVTVFTYSIDIPNAKNSSSKHMEIKVCTSQLESGGTGGGIRKAQIKNLDNVVSSNPNMGNISNQGIIFAGDTNISSWQTELNNILPGLPGAGWMDAWREKGTSDNEHTNNQTHDRMDRIWYKGALRCMSYDLICMISYSHRLAVVAEFEILV